MVSSGLSGQLQSEIAGRLLASIFTCALWFGIVIALLMIFRIRNPSIRYMLTLIPLAKSLVVLMRQPAQIQPFKGAFMINVQMPIPSDLMPSLPDHYSSVMPAFFKPEPSFLTLNISLIIALTIGFFLWRVLGLIRFQRIVSRAPEIEFDGNRTLYGVLDRLVLAARVDRPKLVRVNSQEAPFTIGFTRPVIALSTVILKRLTAEEMEAVLAHEIAHIARKDHLLHWPVVLLRDVLFFNPFTYLIYSRLSFERERACDDYGSRLSQPLRLAKSLIKMEELRKFEPSLSPTRAFAPQSLLRRESWLAQRVGELLEPSPYRSLSASRRTSFIVIGLFLFYVELHMTITLYGTPLVLS